MSEQSTMQRIAGSKFLLIGLVALILVVPLNMIHGLAGERQAYHQEAIGSMAESSTGAQRVIGPVLVLPCVETFMVSYYDEQEKAQRQRPATRDCTTYALPDQLVVDGGVTTETRRRGIHAALFYLADVRVEADFVVPERFGSGEPDTTVELGAALVSVGFADTRGVSNVPTLAVDGASVPFEPGTGLNVLGNGIHAQIDAPAPGARLATSFQLQLRGMERLDIVPLGHQSTIRLQSAWPHPSFVGRYLPVDHEITPAGFSARWSTSYFATGLEQLFAENFRSAKPVAVLDDNSLGVTLMDPVDLYVQVDRAVKYGFLFVLLTFIALIATEVMQRLRLHPVQYTMVGVALAMFFLLLLSLSEHFGFRTAYAIATFACVALLGYYTRHVARSRTIGAVFAAGLIALYGVLYGLLASEDYALLMGSVFVFGVLAVLMVLTRDFDWYKLGGARAADDGLPTAV